MASDIIRVKQFLCNSVLKFVEKSLYDQQNDNSASPLLHGGGNDVNGYSSTGFSFPGKFEAIRNSYQISISDAIRSSRERQQMFINESNAKTN